MKRRWRTWLGLGVLILVTGILGPWLFQLAMGWIHGVDSYAIDSPPNYPLASVEKDNRPPFRLIPVEAYRIEFVRGSGWHGLDTIKVNQDGTVVLHRLAGSDCYTATIHLSEQSVAQILQAIEDNHLLGMDRAYHANVADGTQWVFWIRQGDNERSIYFNNHFPQEILRFAKSLDEALCESGLGKVAWHPVAPWRGNREHEKELWESITR